VTRHRSPAAGEAGAAVDVRRLLAGSGRPLPESRRCALRRGVTAAAVTGGALAIAAPAATLLPTTVEVPQAAAIGLAAADLGEPEPLVVNGSALAASVLPVSREIEPPVAAQNLLKSARLNETARAAEEARLARAARVNCAAPLSGLGAVKPHVKDAARFLSCLYDQPDLIGVAGRGRVSDHPTGLAVDLLTRGAEGDRIAACALANRKALGISYVIWGQRINYGSGWEPMENRGSVTENHFDHVHISFERSAGSGDPDPDLCS
jgi:hypothetical protein